MPTTANSDVGTPTNNSETSTLLELPPELRNIIYREVLVTTDALFPQRPPKKHMEKLVSQMQLLHVCRQIRNEAHNLFWKENTFRITIFRTILRSPRWMSLFGKERLSLITKFTIAVNLCGPNNVSSRSVVSLHLTAVPEVVQQILASGIAISAIELVEPTRRAAL